MDPSPRRLPLWPIVGYGWRYGLAFLAVGVALLLRQGLLWGVGSMPPYITFFPAIMVVAILAGVGPGLLATALAALAADFYILEPRYQWTIANPADVVGLGLFVAIGVFMTTVAEFYGRARRRAAGYEKELSQRQAQAEWERTFDSVPDLIAVIDNQHRILRANRAMAQRLGLTPQQCVGQLCHCAVHGTDGPPPFCPHALTIVDGREHVAEVHEDRPGGDFLVSTTPLQDESGRQIGFVHVARDITELKRAENARAAAEAANRAKSGLLANVGHEIRTPMNAILGMTDLALADETSPVLRDRLLAIREAAGTLMELLNQILDLARIEAGRLQLNPAPFSLRGVIDQTLKMMGFRAYEKGLELLCDLPPRVPDALLGDALRLRQILVNLVGNAVKFTFRGEVLLMVDVEPSPDGPPGETLLRFSVADTGIGIAPEDQQQIFVPFIQLDASSTRSYGGTGLGLSIAANLVELMNGRIWVESQPGRGSIFHFTVRLPLQSLTAPGDETADEATAALHGLRALVVDDSPMSCQILQRLLGQWGLQPESVHDAATALAAIQQAAARGQPWPLVLIDAMMPEINGFELAQWLQTDPGLVGAMVLLASPVDLHRRGADRLEPGVARADKPINRANLRAALCQALGKAVEGPAAPRPTAAVVPAPVRPLKILLAEDTPVSQEIVAALLEKRGHTIAIAHDGSEAAQRACREEFDLVLMDIQMPIMDGYQAAAAIRAHQRSAGRRVPIVAMTAYALKSDEERSQAAGLDGHLSKPIDGSKLIALVERLAQAGPAAGPATSPPPGEAPPSPEPAVPRRPSSVFRLDEAMQRCCSLTMFRRMVAFFFADSADLLAQVRTALGQGDTAQIARAAHRLKGTVFYLGAEPTVAAVVRLEEVCQAGQTRQAGQASQAGDLTAAAEAAARLETEVQRLGQSLQPYYQGK